MARSNPKPLRIIVAGCGVQDALFKSKPVQALIEKGHDIEYIDSLSHDVIIGPRCWRIDPSLKLGDDHTEEESLERQLEMMEKGVRAIKYPKEKKDVLENKG